MKRTLAFILGAMIAFATGAALMDAAYYPEPQAVVRIQPTRPLPALICEHYQILSRPCPKGIKA